MSIKREILLLTLIITGSLLGALLLYADFAFIGTDGVAYTLTGQNIAEGNGLTLYNIPHTVFPPLFPAAIALFHLLISDLELAAHVTTFAFALASILLFHFLVRRMTDASTALVATAFFGLSGLFIKMYAAIPTPQILAGFLAILTFLFLLRVSDVKSRMSRRDAISLFFLGVVIGFSYLARSEYFLIIFPVIVYLAVLYWRRLPVKRLMGAVLLVVFGFAIVSGPYLVFLHNNLGYWTITGKATTSLTLVLRGETRDLPGEGQGDGFSGVRTLSTETIKSATQDKIQTAAALMKRLFTGLRDAERALVQVFGFLGIGLFSFGVVRFIVQRRIKEIILSLIVLTPLPLVVFVVGGKPNYLVQYLFVFIFYMAVGFWWVLDRLREHLQLSQALHTSLVFLLATASLFYFFFPVLQTHFFAPRSNVALEYKQLGTWMREHLPDVEDHFVLARKPEPTFYAGAYFKEIPQVDDIPGLVRYMQEQNINYVIVDDRNFPDSYKQLRNLLNTDRAREGLELVRTEEFGGNRTILYALE